MLFRSAYIYPNKFPNQVLEVVSDRFNKDRSNRSKNRNKSLDGSYENITTQSNTTLITKNSKNDINFIYDPHVHVIANKLQNMVKRRYTIMTRNQIKISSVYRGCVLRRETELKKEHAKIIQKYWRKQFQTRLSAANIIAFFCIRTKRQKQLFKSIMILQSFLRMILPRRCYSDNKAINNAAFVLQHQWWIWNCKRFLNGLIDHVVMQFVTMQATRISSCYRRHRSQKKAAFIRERILQRENGRNIQEFQHISDAISFSLLTTTFLMYSELVSLKT